MSVHKRLLIFMSSYVFTFCVYYWNSMLVVQGVLETLKTKHSILLRASSFVASCFSFFYLSKVVFGKNCSSVTILKLNLLKISVKI